MEGPGGPGGGGLPEQVVEADPAVKQEADLIVRGVQLQVIAAARDQTQLQVPGRQVVDVEVGQVQRDHPSRGRRWKRKSRRWGRGGRGWGDGGTW